MDDYHLLAVGSDQIGPVGDHSVEAGAACNYILHRSRFVPGVYHVVAGTAESTSLENSKAVVDQQVATSLAQHAVGASPTVDEVPAFPAYQVV